MVPARSQRLGTRQFFSHSVASRRIVREEIAPDGPELISLLSLPVDFVGADAARNEPLKKLYVGNLPFSATEEGLRELFEQHGTTESVRIITDRETGRSRGFGFVEFEDDSAAEKALQALNGADMEGRALRVNEAQDKRGGGGGGGGRGGYGGGRH